MFIYFLVGVLLKIKHQLMQECYSHCVPKDTSALAGSSNNVDGNGNNENSRRICVVFRTGDEKYFYKDTGEACCDLSPRKPIVYHIGHVASLKEGYMYTRAELRKAGAFQVSSNITKMTLE